jgi:hypothetical protein
LRQENPFASPVNVEPSQTEDFAAAHSRCNGEDGA